MPVPTLQDVLDRLRQNEVEAAIDVLEETVDELPAHPAAHVILARAYEAKQQWDHALQAWENARFLLPNSPTVQEGKQRVLRHMDGTETSSEPTGAEASSAEPAPKEASRDAKDTPSTSEKASELEHLRRETEKRARQGGARSGLTDDAPPPESISTPEEQVEQFDDEAADYELDHLIQELESARIEPQPDMEDVPAPELDNDVDDLVSETLAQIHAAQGQYREAARIYRQLASQEPGQFDAHLQKAEEMRRKAEAEEEEE